jgi:hypothetical protein
MDNREKLIEYQGEINYTVISNILKELKRKTDQKNEPVYIYKRLLSITDETLENISMYMDKNPDQLNVFEKYPSAFQLIANSESYWIITRNLLKNCDQEELSEQIDRINAYNEDELKFIYKETISNGKLSEQGGAGLGLLIIAKASCNKINYTFEQLNQEFSYFSLIIEIPK